MFGAEEVLCGAEQSVICKIEYVKLWWHKSEFIVMMLDYIIKVFEFIILVNIEHGT